MANLLEEEFDDITTLAGAGYTFVNASDVIGTTDWAQGITAVFESQAGAPDAYLSANFNNTAGSVISNWMVTPQLNLENGDEITFWTRTVTGSTFPDRLEVRLSPDGTTTAPASPTDEGSYTELLLEINPNLDAGGYPDVWTEFTVVVSGLTGAVDTNVAFRYFVTDAGPTGANSNFIGIDTLSIDEAAVVSVVTGYDNLTDFQAACTGTLAMEDFTNGASTITVCGPVVSSAGGGCFAAGEIIDGFDVQSTNSADLVIIPINTFGNTSDLVGAASFADATVINFTGPDDVFAVGMDVYNNLDVDTDFRVYDTGGMLLDFFTLNNAIDTQNFFAVVSTTAIGKIEVEGLNASGELIGNLQFGDCGGGGGGGMACSQSNPGNGFENGLFTDPVNGFIVANDLVVDAGIDFTMNQLTANFFHDMGETIASIDVAYYEDASGLPGTQIGSEVGVVPSSQMVVGDNFGFDISETIFDLTPFTFLGDSAADKTYWISLSVVSTSGGITAWEVGSASIMGGEAVNSTDGITWAVPIAGLDGVYTFSGECSPISGPPVLSLPLTFEAQTVPFVDFNGSATQAIPNPDASGINTSATVAENLVPGAAALAGVNIVVPVDITSNKYFIMDVWSPLVDTPVLLRLEGGPNAPVERLVTMTTTGAWEQLLFDFSSEGALDYESVTVFMNFNVVDPANQTYYWDNLELLNAPPPPPAPSNDLCENAIPMSCGEIVSGTTINATEDSAVASECDTTVTAPGVWYEYEDASGVTGDITITMCNGTTDYDSKLSVYSGDCGALVCVVGNDDTCGLQSEVSFQSDGATTFYILVHGFGTGEGNFEIEMTCNLIPPPNDMIANSIDVDEIGFPYTDPAVPTIAATFEAGSPVGCDNSGARGVWYNFVSEGDGTATASMTTPGGGGLFFTVNNGPLAGSYDAIAAAFGGAFTTAVISEDTVVMIDDDASGDENDACDPLLNGASLAGKIAIARRGACAFTDKVIAAQNEGAIAVIVVNNQPGGPIVMGGDNPDITIPALMLGDADGEAVIAEVLGGGTLNVSMGLEAQGFNAVTFYTAPNENAVETDLELVDWFENQCLPGTSASIPTVAGQAYYVFVANHVGVTDIVIDGTNLGTEDITIEGFVYYPNPAGNTINLRAQENIERAAIYNMLGQKVLDQNVNAISSELNLSNLATGTYILQVSVNGQIGNYQILKK
jgi:hypothetical protein